MQVVFEGAIIDPSSKMHAKQGAKAPSELDGNQVPRRRPFMRVYCASLVGIMYKRMPPTRSHALLLLSVDRPISP